MVNALRRWMEGFERVSRTVAAACLVAVMLIVFTDVAARYLVHAPLAWSYDVIGMYLMPALFYLALSDTLAGEHHIAVDLLRPRMPAWLLRVTEVVGNGAMAAVFLLIAWIYGASALDNYASGARVMNAVQWPSWIPEAIVVLGAFTISLRLVGRAIGHAVSLITRRPVIELPSSVEA